MITQVDAFTNKPFAGNPAAVCVLQEDRDDRWMQLVAREMSLSETAFLRKTEEGFDLRWFTPSVEVDLCGHATLASAHVLWEEGHLPAAATARFRTRSGILTAGRQDSWIAMDFPAKPEVEAAPPDGLQEALGVPLVYVGKSQFDYLVEVDSEERVRKLDPNIALLSRVEARGIIVTSRCESKEFDFVSRFFAPRAGVNEDPVTGSSHCCLGPYWRKKLGKSDFVAYQASARGGIVRVAAKGDRVQLCGQAVTVFRGALI